ncbi:MAG: AAA family ATPase [Lachnotalea sp.]
MNLLKRIKIENVKGKESFEVTFTDLIANQPNIIVAPNGYGKSTIATAFKAASSGKMKLDSKDVYQQNPVNHPKLEIELYGENSGIFVSTDTEGNISKHLSVYTISSPLYAKNTTRGFNRNVAATADLRVEQVVIYNSIPENQCINYSYRSVSSEYGNRSKLFLNISEMLTNFNNISQLIEIKECLKKCSTQQGIQSKFTQFLANCPSSGTAKNVKQQISQDSITTLLRNSNINILFNCVNGMESKPNEWCDIDVVFTAIQLCRIMNQYYDAGDNDIFKRVYNYLLYIETRNLIDERLNLFNTTGRNIRTREEHGKLVISFERADAMSNGERDILSFVSNLTKFEIGFKKQIGILIIDEVFDYLDGSNMLVVQYYLSELINKCKSVGKVLFPIIFTHLDPEVFSNYYFRKKKVHYISSFAPIELDSHIVKILRLREGGALSDDEKEEIEKYYLHFIDEPHSLSEQLAAKISSDFNESSTLFKSHLYEEIKDKYLAENSYNPVMIIAGVRIRIEEMVYRQLSPSDQLEFIKKHKVINKLLYAEDIGIEVQELFYLLQPLYNDGLHLGGNDNDVRRKIKSCYLKTNNLHIRRMIQMLFMT